MTGRVDGRGKFILLHFRTMVRVQRQPDHYRASGVKVHPRKGRGKREKQHLRRGRNIAIVNAYTRIDSEAALADRSLYGHSYNGPYTAGYGHSYELFGRAHGAGIGVGQLK